MLHPAVAAVEDCIIARERPRTPQGPHGRPPRRARRPALRAARHRRQRCHPAPFRSHRGAPRRRGSRRRPLHCPRHRPGPRRLLLSVRLPPPRTHPRGSSVDGKETDGSVPSTPSHSVLGDAMSLKESSDQSSSVIDDEGCTRRGPTVVARLMGLDSMPAASSSGPYPMPFSGQHAFQNNAHDELIGRSYVGISSPHKMPSSPIDRFSMETLPPRFARRTLSVPQQKLFSPVKNPNHVSIRNPADIMEAASRIIGPGVENSSSYRVRDVGYSNDVRAFNPREIVRVQQMSQAAKKRDVSASSKPPSGKLSDASSKKCDPDK